MTLKTITARLIAPLVLSVALVSQASAWGGWGWDSNASGQSRAGSREGHHAVAGGGSQAIGSQVGSSSGQSSGNGGWVHPTGGYGWKGHGGGGGGTGGSGGSGGSGGTGGGSGGSGGTGGGTGGTGGTGGPGGPGPVTSVGAPEIDGPAGIAALALLFSAGLLAFRRFSR